MSLNPLTAATATQPTDDREISIEDVMGKPNETDQILRIAFLERQLIDLDNQLPTVKAFYEERSRVITELVTLAGTEHYFQSESGQVFKTVEETGRYVVFERFGYVRTKKPNEPKGTLSMKEAIEAGFRLNDN